MRGYTEVPRAEAGESRKIMITMTEPDASVAILHTPEPDGSILLMRRTERATDPWSGHWSLPGGKRDAADRDPLDTALRELQEECGIRLEREQMTAALPHALARRRTGRCLVVAPFLFRVDARLPTVLDPEEAVETLWIPVRSLLDPARHSLRPVPGRAEWVLFPAIDLDHVPLWGFTYRLLSDWLALTPPPQAGREAARLVLERVLACGAKLRQDWKDRVASVAGAIPVAAVVAWFRDPAHFHPAVNCLEVAADQIRIIGPAFEEYLISATGAG